MALFTVNQTADEFGQKSAFGIPYSQFVRFDNAVKVYQKFSRNRVLAMRFQGGLGYTYGNSKTAMPFDYAFFAGGSNDNRGWRARELSPGAYQYHKDSLSTITQIGDIRLGASVEYRFKIPFVSRFNGAIFSDMGNIWTLRDDPNRIGAQFTSRFYEQIAISGGLGLRLDLSFLIIRFDVGVPIHNPAMSQGARWIWNSRDIFEQELDVVYGNSPSRQNVLRPFVPKYHFAIGFPF
jgi:outer membrane protein assembly factor BamA